APPGGCCVPGAPFCRLDPVAAGHYTRLTCSVRPDRSVSQLPHHAHAELHIPPVVCRRDHAGGYVGNVRVGIAEVRVIEQVEDLRTELQPPRTAERHTLDERHVDDLRARSAHRVATRGALRARRWYRICA